MLVNLLNLVTPIFRTKINFMRKILASIALVLCITLLTQRCIPKQYKCIDGISFESVDRAQALEMIDHYYDDTVIKNDTTIITRISLNRNELNCLLEDKKVVGIKLIVAAFLESHPNPAIRHDPTVLIQTKKQDGETITYKYYQMKSATMKVKPDDSEYCPPPPACPPEG